MIENNLTLNHIPLAFYIILCCLSFSIVILLIEIFMKMAQKYLHPKHELTLN